MQETMLAGKPMLAVENAIQKKKNGNVSRRMRENERYSMEIDNIKNGEFNLKIIDIKR